MTERDEYLDPILEIGPGLAPVALDRLGKAVDLVREEGDPVTFSTVTVAAIRISLDSMSMSRVDGLFTHGWNEGALYRFVCNHAEELGISLYQEAVNPFLEIDPGTPTTMRLREQLGYYLVEHLPETFSDIQSAGKATFYRLDQCERGIVGELCFGNESRVLKCTSSPLETEIALYLGKLGISPIVFEATSDVIVEEHIAASPISQIIGKEGSKFIGGVVGSVLSTLHAEGVIYDNWLGDHILLADNGARIIDLERARWGNDYETDWQIAERDIRDNLYRGKRRQAARAVRAMKRSI